MNRSRARAIRRKYQRRTRVTVQKAWILSALAAAVIVYGARWISSERTFTFLAMRKKGIVIIITFKEL